MSKTSVTGISSGILTQTTYSKTIRMESSHTPRMRYFGHVGSRYRRISTDDVHLRKSFNVFRFIFRRKGPIILKRFRLVDMGNINGKIMLKNM